MVAMSGTGPKPTPGLRERHSRTCSSASGRCNCSPSVEAFVFDRRSGRKIRKTFSGKGAKAAAKQWRADALSALGKGALKAPVRRTLREEAEEWHRRAENLASANRQIVTVDEMKAVLGVYVRAMFELGRHAPANVRQNIVEQMHSELRALDAVEVDVQPEEGA
jgi:hypothetical protein